MARIFQLISAAPISTRISSKECSTYVYRTMKIIGWIPPKHGIERYVYLMWSFVLFTFAINCLIGLILSAYVNAENLEPENLIDVLTSIFNTAGSISKCISVLICFTALRETNLVLDELDEYLITDDEHRTIHKAVAFANYVFVIYLALYIGYLVACLIAALIMGHPPFIIYNVFFDWQDGVIQFWVQVIFEFIMSVVIVFNILIGDTCPVVLMIIFRALIDVLKDKIRNLRCDLQKTEKENYEDLVRCIKYHKLVLKCCKLVRPLISRIIFVQFLLIGSILGLGLIKVIYYFNFVNTISSLIFFIALMLESFPFSYCCDLLVKDCEDLSNLVAQSQWISAERKYKSTLRIFLHHVQQPITFTAGGIFPISLNTNIQMAKFAFSVMTILQNMDLFKQPE